MADWKKLTPAQQAHLKRLLETGLQERGIHVESIDLDPSGLAGRHRLYVVAKDFERLDYSERLEMLDRVLQEQWDRFDQPRLTLRFPLSPDEVPEQDATQTTRRRRPPAAQRRVKRA